MTRKANPADRRSLLLELTPAGTHAMQWTAAHFADATAVALQGISENATGDIAGFLERISERLLAAAAATPDPTHA